MLLSRTFFAGLLCAHALLADPATSKVYVFGGPGGATFVIDAKTTSVVAMVPPPALGGSCGYGAFSPDGVYLYCTAPSLGSLQALDTATNTFSGLIPVAAFPGDLAISPDGQRAWVISYNPNIISVVDLASQQVVGSLTVGSTPLGIAITNDGSRVYVSDQGANTVYVIDAASMAITGAIPVGAFPGPLRFSPDGTELWVTVTGGAQVIDPMGNTVIAMVQLPSPLSFGGVSGIAFHPSNRWAYLTQGGAGGGPIGPIVVDRAAKQVQKVLQTTKGSWNIAVTADGTRGIAPNPDGTLTVLDTNGNSVNGSLTLADFIGLAVAWQPQVPAIRPSACVTHNNNGTYTAKFSYDDFADQAFTIPVGPSNSFSPGPADRGQVTVFHSGGDKNALTLTFDGAPLTWSVRAPFGMVGSVIVSAASKGCQ